MSPVRGHRTTAVPPWSAQLNPRDPPTAATWNQERKKQMKHREMEGKRCCRKENDPVGTWLQWGLREPRGWQAQGRQPCPLASPQCPAAHCPQSLPTTLGRQEQLPLSPSQGTASCRVPRALQLHPATGRGWLCWEQPPEGAAATPGGAVPLSLPT